MAIGTYLFIDGGYLNVEYKKIMQKWTSTDGELNYRNIKMRMNATKCFYYDCKDEVKRPSENDVDFKARKDKQEEFFNSIREINGTHVRLGHLTGVNKKQRQKEVDILLAVDMMNHAIRQNMTQATLIAGDRDFKPLVESLVQMGLYVEIVADQSSVSKDFAYAADSFRKITFVDYHNWSSDTVQVNFPIPHILGNGGSPQSDGATLIKQGLYKTYTVQLYELKNNYMLKADYILYFPRFESSQQSTRFTFNDLIRLELFFNLEYGNIDW